MNVYNFNEEYIVNLENIEILIYFCLKYEDNFVKEGKDLSCVDVLGDYKRCLNFNCFLFLK